MSYGHQGKEQDSGIYTRYMIRMVRGAYALAQLAGHSRLAAAARRWIRARVGTWLTTALEGRSLMPSPAIRDAWRGPGALVARDPAHVTSLDSSITVPNAGPRSISTQNDGSMKLAIDSLAGTYLSEALGLPGRPSSHTAALRKRWPDRPELWDWCLSAEERELALRGLRGDDAALVDVVDRLAGSYPWRHEKTIGRNGGRSSFVVVHENASSSTAGTHLAQGRVIPGGLVEAECLTAQYGPRKSGKPEHFDPNAYAVGPSVATIVGDVVRARRTDDKPYPLKKDGPLTMEHPTVERRLFVDPSTASILWRQGPDGLRVVQGPGAQPAPEPAPEPTGPADAFDWLVNAGRRRAAVGPGFYGTISPVAGHPHVFILRKGPGEVPWSTELLWRDEAQGRIALVAECGYESGVLANFRIFFDETGRPGVTWLRRSIDRERGDTFRCLGTVIEHAVTDGGDPYRGDGADLPAGQVRESKVDADSTVEHVGVTTTLGERVAILRRADLMGDRSKPATREREVYEIGFGDGAFGYVKWDSYRDGVFDRGGAATRIEPDGGPALCFGVDPEDPELRERWFATPDYAGELPAVGAPTRRPSTPSPEPKRDKPSWIERMGL